MPRDNASYEKGGNLRAGAKREARPYRVYCRRVGKSARKMRFLGKPALFSSRHVDNMALRASPQHSAELKSTQCIKRFGGLVLTMRKNRNGNASANVKRLERARSEIASFDEVAKGGVPKGRPTIVCGSPSCGKTMLSMRGKAGAASKKVNGNSRPMELRLYVAGQTPRSLAALVNLRKICAEHLDGQYKLQVIDLIKTPQLAQNDQILAIPTLVRKLPEPIRKIIGDLSDRKRVLVGLNLRETEGVE